ncbi:ABC transporter [Sphaerisporangium krabiense]|uniref:NitT/TauT family transport system ATP-binding protein n=1 Tax=Sphaerisporangium krabiense TaxID=763782 RepID=A0A7W8ZBW4_9ACTN|nr:ABC transporter ATP-binding protein [Sphaerisporangium krabiense]MBB5631055.1 NitT/TauT family transport system ATP-binding protein [Sphaerisporangium krabiense]GII65938.1 ABC transporter [Sphaerisporangium krabiense]
MLEVTGLSKSYGEGGGAVRAIDDLTFTVNPHEFVCIVGPSGCGKTTLLKCLSGLMAPTGGRAVLAGTVIKDPPETLALVFQEYTRSLLPWMTVLDNVVLPLRAKGVDKAERRRLALESLEAVGLAEFTHVYPWQLSGGMQQRVAIARALAYQPKVLLMDEPFASVDAQTRAELEDLMLRVRDAFDVTVVLVTHDIDEAVYLADRVVVLSKRPTRVREIVEIDLPGPRDQVTTKENPRFAQLRGHVARLIVGVPAGRPEHGEVPSAPAEVA